MRNIIFTFLLSILLVSCASYLDKKSIVNVHFELNVFKDFNIYKEIHFVHEKRDKEIYYINDFQIRLPKKIVFFQTGTYDFFEYPSKQIIVIRSGYRNIKNQNWELREATRNEILNYLDDFWSEREYNSSILEDQSKNRITKVYSNNNTIIVLFNIKEENFKAFLTEIKDFEYINESK